jgi:asparagine synthase (glutamine-hydrolysing)
MKTAREAGLKVMLDGQGGDETLLGYERYYIAFFGNLFRRRKWLELLKEYIFAARHSKLSFLRLIAYTLYFSILPIRRFVLKRRTRFLKNEYSTASEKTLREISKYFFNLNELQVSEIEFKQLPSLLKYEDRNSMSHAIEARVPYIELSCISAALSLLPEEKIRDGFTKYPLRVIAKDILPSSIAWRREKIGFEAPSRTWLDNHHMIMQLELSNSKILDHICAYLPDPEQLNPEIQWRLYNIAVWEKLYHVQI